jgi:hypothetical protein
MPKGPRGEQRPADVIGCAVAVARISVGEEDDAVRPPSGRTRSGKAGGLARAKALTQTQRQVIAKNAANRRWG